MNIQQLRKRGIEEFVEISHEIIYLQNNVDKMPLIDRKYFYRTGRQLMKQYDVWDWMLLEKQLEAYNCAYERLIDYRKLSRFQKIKQYLK